MVDPMFALGTLYYWRQDLTHAREWFERLLSVDPEHVGAHYQLGKMAAQAGRTDQAIGHFELCARKAPANKGVRYQLARAYRAKGQVENADREFAAFQSLRSDASIDLDARDQRLDRIGNLTK
jgi:tetratricopeptide (TPR) repeat protein